MGRDQPWALLRRQAVHGVDRVAHATLIVVRHETNGVDLQPPCLRSELDRLELGLEELDMGEKLLRALRTDQSAQPATFVVLHVRTIGVRVSFGASPLVVLVISPEKQRIAQNVDVLLHLLESLVEVVARLERLTQRAAEELPEGILLGAEGW